MIILPSTSKLTATATNNVLTCNWDAMVFPSQPTMTPDMPRWHPFAPLPSKGNGGRCNQNICGIPSVLTGPSSPGSCTPTNQRSFPVRTCGHIFLSLSTVPTRTRSENVRVRIEMQSMIDGTKSSATWVHTRWPKPFSGLILMSQWWASTLTTSQRRKLFSQLHKSNSRIARTGQIVQVHKQETNSHKLAAATNS